MSNAHKTLSILLTALAALTLGSCASNSRADQATALLEGASQATAQKDYTKAFSMLDSLDRAYRDCLEQRREGTRLRTEALRDLTLDSIAQNDAQLIRLQATVDSLQGKFTHEEISSTRGYEVYIPAKATWNINRTGLQPRIDDEGYFFIAVNYEGRPIGLHGLSTCGEKVFSGQHFAVGNSESMTVSQIFCTDLMKALVQASAPVKMTLLGENGQASVTLDAAALEAFKATWQYAIARQDLRTNLIRREKLERQLSRLRDTLANLPTAEEIAADN